MKLLSAVLVLVGVLVIAFAGISQLSALSNEAGSSINESSDLYESLQTADNVTETAMTTISLLPYLLFVAILIIGLGMIVV